MTPEQLGAGSFASYQCQTCHRVGDKGGDAGPDLTFAGVRKSQEFMALWLKDPKAWQRNTAMPNFHLNDEARANLAAYMGSLKGELYRVGVAPWDKIQGDPVARGAELFKRVGCVTCHGRAGKGGYSNNNVKGGVIPALYKVKATYIKEELITK